MHLDQLRYLVDLKKTGSISASAERLYVTQQAISKSMKKLESELDIMILEREKTGVSFTAAGYEVLEFAQKVLNDEETLRNKLFELKLSCNNMQSQKKLHISSASSVLNLVLPKIMSKSYLKKKQYRVNISVIDNTENLMEQISQGTKDIGFISINENNLMRVYADYKDILQLDILMRDELVAVMDRRYYVGDDYTLDPYAHNFDAPSTSYNIVSMDADIYGDDLVYSTDADFHRSMMEHAGAIVYMSRMAYQYFFGKKKYVMLSLENMEIPLAHAAIYRKDAEPIVQEFVDLIRTEMHTKEY